jgi:hypothetical protein
MQHTMFNMQHATCNIHRPTCDGEGTTCNRQQELTDRSCASFLSRHANSSSIAPHARETERGKSRGVVQGNTSLVVLYVLQARAVCIDREVAHKLAHVLVAPRNRVAMAVDIRTAWQFLVEPLWLLGPNSGARRSIYPIRHAVCLSESRSGGEWVRWTA